MNNTNGNVWINQVFYMGVMIVASNLADAGTIDTSEQAPYEQCGYCHEYDGNSIMPDYPKLAGQQKEYLIKQLMDFKNGKRKGLMQATAELLTKEDINVVASYFSQQMANSSNQSSRIGAEIIQYGRTADLGARSAPKGRGPGTAPVNSNRGPAN